MILSLLEERQTKSPLDDFWYRPLLGFGASSMRTDGDAMTLSAWWNAVTLLSATIASIPLRLYRRDGEDRVPLRGDPRFHLMHRQPTPWHTAMEWREMAQGHLLMRGNSYHRMIRDRLGRVRTLEPLHPDRVTIETEDGQLVYVARRKSGTEYIPASEMLHLRGPGSDGITGLSVIALARRSLGYALDLEKHGAEITNNQARPGGLLTTDATLQKEKREALAKAWDQAYSGGGIGRTAVLDAGLEWQAMSFNAEDSQFIESRAFQVTEVARWLNIPPHFLKDLSKATYSNIEQQSLEFVIHTIRPWCERWEQRLDVALLDADEREDLYFKFSLEGLMRGDSEARSAFYTALFQMGALSPNEIRRLEDMNGVEGGDERFVQLNLVPLSQASDPFGAMTDATDRAIEGAKDVRQLPAGVEERSLRQRRRLMVVHQRLMEEAAGRLVRREIADLRRLLDATDDVDDFLRRLDIFAEGLPGTARNVMAPLLVAYIDLVAEAASEEIGDELDRERLEAWREGYVDSFARGHTSQTVDRLTGTMTEAKGDPFDNARSMLGRWEENRAAEIALREAVTAGGAAAVVVFEMAGLGAVWRTSGSENCPYCDMLNGRRVGPGGRFLSKGEKLEPEGSEPLHVGRDIGHPQAHGGCDCMVAAG